MGKIRFFIVRNAVVEYGKKQDGLSVKNVKYFMTQNDIVRVDVKDADNKITVTDILFVMDVFKEELY